MSGPKVVRIVTREEIIAICLSRLAEMRAAARVFSGRARRCDKLDSAAEKALATRIAALEGLLER
jgi:hypothetical protein